MCKWQSLAAYILCTSVNEEIAQVSSSHMPGGKKKALTCYSNKYALKYVTLQYLKIRSTEIFKMGWTGKRN